jgi:hypothetical protein
MLKEGIVTYKFKSEKNYDSIKFTGESISVASLKARVEEKRIRKRDIETGKKMGNIRASHTRSWK